MNKTMKIGDKVTWKTAEGTKGEVTSAGGGSFFVVTWEDGKVTMHAEADERVSDYILRSSR